MEILTTLFRRILRMRRISMAVLVSLVAVAAFTSGRSTADHSKKVEAMTENKLVGTWKMVKARYGGKEANVLSEEHTEFKHVTPAHFILVAIDKDGKVGGAIGGAFTLRGGKYGERAAGGASGIVKKIIARTQAVV